MTFINSIFLLLSGQGLFLAYLLYQQKKIKANPWVSYYFICFSVILIAWVIFWNDDIPRKYKLVTFAVPFQLLMGPFLYLSITQARSSKVKHYIAAILGTLILLPFWIYIFFPYTLNPLYEEYIGLISRLIHFFTLGLIGYYITLSIYKIKTLEHVLLVIGSAAFLLGYFLYHILSHYQIMTLWIDYGLAMMISLSFYMAGYYYFIRYKPYSAKQRGMGNHTGDLLNKIDHYLVNSKSFLNPKYQLENLASDLKHPAQKISGAIGAGKARNFNEHINRFRIQHAKHLLVKSDAKVLAVALESGYKNKVSFIQNFKKFCKMTPHQYRLQNQPDNLIG